MAYSFDLADVAPATTPLPLTSAGHALARLVTPAQPAPVPGMPEAAPVPEFGRLEGCSRARPLVASEFHGLFAAVHHAFDEHRPLRLSPDHIWITIEQGLATHVRLNAEALRERFVSHEGQLRLELRHDEFAPGRVNDWSGVVLEFAQEIRKHIGKKHDLFVADFSTTGVVERCASSVVLMDGMQRYFSYVLRSACGIPRVTLEGTPDDWRAIRERVQYLRELELGWWVDALEPILAQLVETAEGRPDRDFWNSLYKRKNASGGPYITGWIQVFFPYCGPADQEPTARTQMARWQDGMTTPFGGGPTPDELPPALASVPLRWLYFDQVRELQLLGGFLGVEQDAAGMLSPLVGWAVREPA